MKTIFVVEDDVDIRESLTDFLEDEGFVVISAENGKVALEKLRSMKDLPALIFLDIMMPVMDGRMFRKIQLSDARLSVIPVAVTSAAPDIQELLKEDRIAEFLKKPVDLDKILGVVRSYCI